jgi:hypothetical protein
MTLHWLIISQLDGKAGEVKAHPLAGAMAPAPCIRR